MPLRLFALLRSANRGGVVLPCVYDPCIEYRLPTKVTAALGSRWVAVVQVPVNECDFDGNQASNKSPPSYVCDWQRTSQLVGDFQHTNFREQASARPPRTPS